MNKNLVFKILGVLFAGAALFFAVKVVLSTYAPSDVQTESFGPSTATSLPDESNYDDIEPDVSIPKSEVDYTLPSSDEYVCPVDFEQLRLLNKDIYAWIVIEGTNINYPVLQNSKNDKLYLNHNSDGDYSANGAIFSEHKYNKTDFSDNVTVLYGHHLKNGKFFGKLQKKFTNKEFFESKPVIKVYTENGILEYGVFAAVPFNAKHIMKSNKFTNEKSFNKFFNSVFKVRDLNARFNEEYRPSYGDKVIILSTCLQGDNSRRFLVMGKLLTNDQ